MKNPLQKAWQLAGEKGNHEEDTKASKKASQGKEGPPQVDLKAAPGVQFNRMNEKMRRRVQMHKIKERLIEEEFLKVQPENKDGHPYQFDPETYEYPIPIPTELSKQIELGKPKDTISSLLRIPQNLFTSFVRMT